MVEVNCPQCGQPIPPADLNPGADLAVCRDCNETFTLSECRRAGERRQSLEMDVTYPPAGAWRRTAPDGSADIGATLRSCVAFFLVPFTLFWSGISMSGIYIVPLSNGTLDAGQALFGLPFLIGTCILVPATLMSIFGQVNYRIDGANSNVFLGLWGVGWRKPFDWNKVRDVRLEDSRTRVNNQVKKWIVIEFEDGTKLGRGSLIGDARQEYLCAALLRQLAVRDAGGAAAAHPQPVAAGAREADVGGRPSRLRLDEQAGPMPSDDGPRPSGL